MAERAHRLLGLRREVRTVEPLGSRMSLDLSEYMQRRYYDRCYEAPEVRFFQRWLRPADIVVDVGSHVGFFTLLSARLIGQGGEVHAFQPVPNFERLSKSVAFNELSNVWLECTAVGDHEGELNLGLQEERLVGRRATTRSVPSLAR